MTRARCPDCHGEGVVRAESWSDDGYRCRMVERDCAECEGNGWVEADPLADQEWETVEPNGVHVGEWTQLHEVARLAALLGGDVDAASRVVKERAA